MKENPQVIHPATTSMEPVSTSQTGKSSMIGSGCQTASVSLFIAPWQRGHASPWLVSRQGKQALDVTNGMIGSLGVRSHFTVRLWCVRTARKDLDSRAEADSLDWELAWQRRQVNVFALEPKAVKYDWATLALSETMWRGTENLGRATLASALQKLHRLISFTAYFISLYLRIQSRTH